MGVVMLQTLCLVVKVCAFACFLVLQGSAVSSISPSVSAVPAFPPSGEHTSGHVSHGKAFKGNAPTSGSQPNGTVLHPPLALPPSPQMMKGHAPSLLPNAPTLPPPDNSDSPPDTSSRVVPASSPRNPYKRPQQPEHPAMGPEAPVPVASPSRQSPPKSPSIQPSVPGSIPPNSHQNKAPVTFAPVVNAPAPRTGPHNPPPTQLVKPVVPPFILPEPVAPSPSKLQGNIPPVQPILPHEPPSRSPGKHDAPPISTPPPGINPKRAGKPVAAPVNGTAKHHLPVNPSPTNAPSAHKGKGDLNSAPPPIPYPKSAPNTGMHSPASLPSTSIQRHHHRPRENMSAPAPLFYAVPPHAPTKQAPDHPKPNPKTNLGHHVLPPSKSESHDSPVPSPSSTSPPGQTKMPIPSPKVTPPRSSPRNPKMPFQPPFQALPPPPPNEDCASLTCSEPLTNGPPGPLCICVLPIQVGLRLSVALYTFFPLVPELAAEISAGVFMKQSQVRIMGANAASQDPEKTIVLADLVPLGEKFDNTTASLTFQRFWRKQVDIKTNLFGDYEVLYVRYPGLPPSPPSASSDIDIIDGDPYHGHDNSTRTIQPLGVDVRKKGHKNGPNRSIIAIIVLSASVAVILCCAVAWVLLLKNRDCVSQPERTPTTIIPSLAKSSGTNFVFGAKQAGVAAYMVGSGPSSASLSLGSSIAAYAGSAKTFSSSEIERATDNFSETRILGEGGFGRVYSGVLDDGTEVAVKILKRDDHQGGREFLAEVEMLSRLHHRNLVKLIGICTEERTRCLVYELIPNGSVESHLHGVDKETAPLDWAARLKIALGAARGLAYLHEDSSPRVIHRDFKSSNILLEHDFTPKVSDFGLARTALDEENRHISTRVMGTFGYVAPEYAMTGHLLVKSDVYSYGVVLLELLTGRKPVDMSQPPGQENLVSWARPLLTSKEGLALIIDPCLGPDFPFDSITKVAAIASMCVQPEVSHRPFMGEVVQALKLVCNECDETKELGSRSYSNRDLSIDMDARISTNLEHMLDPLCTQSPVSHYDPELDIERGHSMSELLSSSANNGRPEYDSLRRHSSSGPLRTKSRRLWQKMRRLSRGSVSEHGVMFRLWPGSH